LAPITLVGFSGSFALLRMFRRVLPAHEMEQQSVFLIDFNVVESLNCAVRERIAASGRLGITFIRICRFARSYWKGSFIMQDGLSPALMREIAAQFTIDGEFLTCSAFGSGHINDTYQVQFQAGGVKRRYVLQRINIVVFKQPTLLMENILRITRRQRNKLEESGATEIERRCLQFFPTRSGDYLVNSRGDYWRLCQLVERTHTCDFIESTEQAFLTAASFAEFQKMLVDLPGARLHETIPNFHNTVSRFADFEQALRQDSAGRASSCVVESDFALQRKTIAPVLVDLMRQGLIPERITHNDAKLNNILLDDATEEAICIIDLDTVMPGSSLYDFGDMVRSSSCTAAEDEADLSRVRIDLTMFEALVCGYLSVAKDFLNKVEISRLAFCGKLITFEQGIRFLTDYLGGDKYYKIKYPEHNLVRAKNQFKLVAFMEEHEEEMNAIVKRIVARN
jgi:hypothetical protein